MNGNVFIGRGSFIGSGAVVKEGISIGEKVVIAAGQTVLRDTMDCGKRQVLNRTLIIAEAGVNHNGDIELAKHLIDAAADAGADLVKFQTFNTTELASKYAPKADYQTQTTNHAQTQIAMLQQLN